MSTLICIDSYLSDKERIFTCYKLIKQIREVLPEYKILLINKHIESGGLESEVDYYFYYGDSVLIGNPPEELTNSTLYNKPYLFFENACGTLEYWLPLSGLTDYVGNIYNTFIISSKIAESFGFTHVFKVEYDTNFDLGELCSIKNEIEMEKDYLFYGERHEGVWKAFSQYIFDLHICGYNTKLFSDMELIKKDEDYWNLCKKIGYIGKWIEYLIPAILEDKKKTNVFHGLTFPGFLREKYIKTKFDIISNSSSWINRWKEMPRVCRISIDEGMTEIQNKVLLFYWNAGNEFMNIKLKSNIEYEKTISLPRDVWNFDVLEVEQELEFESEIETENGLYSCKQTVSLESLPKLANRFILNSD